MTDACDPKVPIACDLGAIEPAQRAAHLARVTRLFGELPLEVEERPDGLAFRFAPEHYNVVADVVAQERHCCPFFRFVLDVAPAHGPVWLRVTGPPEAKTILTTVAGR
jgi:hypothetical protein